MGEAEIEDIHDRLLPEEVIDAEDRVFRENTLRDAVEFPRGGQVASERLFDNDARMIGQIRGPESFDHHFEARRPDSGVVRSATSGFQRPFDRRERVQVFIITAHVPEQRQQMPEGLLVIDPARSFYAVRHALMQTRPTPFRASDADYRDFEVPSFHNSIERREDNFVGEVPRHAEEHQRVRTGGGHLTSPCPAASTSSGPPNWVMSESKIAIGDRK